MTFGVYIWAGFVRFTNWLGNLLGSEIIVAMKFLIMFVVFTLLIATITLVERKVLALLQRRVGPNYVGYRGRLQFIADAVKLIVKHITVLPLVNRVLYLTIPALVLIISYLFWANLIWGPNLALCDIEYNLFFLCLISGVFSLLVVLIGFLSNNKYAMLSATRAVILTLNAELLMSFLIVCMCAISNSASFSSLAMFQSNLH
jgi:NADH-quinone oxidoreductase subunit H